MAQPQLSMNEQLNTNSAISQTVTSILNHKFFVVAGNKSSAAPQAGLRQPV
jgi:hypothetical protein